jgi:hypothetical protein
MPEHVSRADNLEARLHLAERMLDQRLVVVADVDRYSFIVTDLHRLLLAGLSAHYV